MTRRMKTIRQLIRYLIGAPDVVHTDEGYRAQYVTQYNGLLVADVLELSAEYPPAQRQKIERLIQQASSWVAGTPTKPNSTD